VRPHLFQRVRPQLNFTQPNIVLTTSDGALGRPPLFTLRRHPTTVNAASGGRVDRVHGQGQPKDSPMTWRGPRRTVTVRMLGKVDRSTRIGLCPRMQLTGIRVYNRPSASGGSAHCG